jgi:hypothetical protein
MAHSVHVGFCLFKISKDFSKFKRKKEIKLKFQWKFRHEHQDKLQNQPPLPHVALICHRHHITSLSLVATLQKLRKPGEVENLTINLMSRKAVFGCAPFGVKTGARVGMRWKKRTTDCCWISTSYYYHHQHGLLCRHVKIMIMYSCVAQQVLFF